MPGTFLTAKERERLACFPDDIPNWDLITYFTLTEQDRTFSRLTVAILTAWALPFSYVRCAIWAFARRRCMKRRWKPSRIWPDS